MGNNRFVWLIILLFLPIPLALQGLDLTDFGFGLAHYDAFFRHPDAVPYAFLYYNTNLIGGALLRLFAGHEVATAKLAWVVVSWLTLYAAWWGSTPFRRTRESTLPLLLGALATCGLHNTRWIDYNNLTLLFYAWTLALLYRGAVDGKSRRYFAAGTLLGFALFLKTPNLSGLVLGAVIPLHAGLAPAARKNLPKNLGVFSAGLAVGVGTTFAVMGALGHFSLWQASWRFLVTEASTRGSNHPVVWIVVNYLGKMGIGVVFFGLMAVLLRHLWRRGVFTFGRNRHCQIGIRGSLVLGLTTTGLLLTGQTSWSALPIPAAIRPIPLTVAGAILFLTGETFWRNRRRRPGLAALAAGLFLLLLLLPFGSATSEYNALLALTFVLPILLFASPRRLTIRKSFCPAASRSPRFYVRPALTILSLSLFLPFVWRDTYRDANGWRGRTALRYEVDDPRFRGVYTTKERARVLSEFIAAARTCIPSDAPLIEHGSIPILHFITHARPVLGGAWSDVMLNLHAGQEEKTLRDGVAAHPDVVFVLAKFVARPASWPCVDPIEGAEYVHDSDQIRLPILRTLLPTLHYRKTWENDAFEIWLPPNVNPPP